MSSDGVPTLREFMATLPQGHHERAGLARAIELLNFGAEYAAETEYAVEKVNPNHPELLPTYSRPVPDVNWTHPSGPHERIVQRTVTPWAPVAAERSSSPVGGTQ